MANVLEVTADDVARLTETQLHQLLEQLLEAEKRFAKSETAKVIVSHEVRASDGGVDGEWILEVSSTPGFGEIPAEVREFIPTPHVVYQCKATEMGPKKCAAEVVDKDNNIKSSIRNRLDKPDGEASYVIACTQKVGNRDSINERETQCREALATRGIQNPTVRFLDAESVARWANRHVASRKFVLRHVGRELAAGMLLISELAASPDVRDFPFCANTELRRLLVEIRTALAGAARIIRVTGNSGLGKTRVVFEIFNATLDGEDALNELGASLGKAVIYIDLEAKTSVQQDLSAVREACLRGDRGIVVIDNCPVDQHETFAKWFLAEKCNLKLITIDYFEDQGSSRGTPFILRPELFKDLVPKILRESPVAQELSDSAITSISEFAQGYPRVAVLAAELGRAPTAADRNYKEYVERLLWGRNPPDQAERHKRYIKALSSVAVFGVGGRVADQYSFLLKRLLGSSSTDEWRSELNYFRRRRILEPLGDFMVVSPAPVAVALFSQWLEETPPEELVEFAQSLPDIGLLDSFCKQLRRVGMNPTAGEIAERFCSGPFASAENLTSGSGSQILRALADLNPAAVAKLVDRVFGKLTPDDVLRIDGTTRRNVVRTLVRLAAEEVSFRTALRLLVLFAAAENERWANNATGSLKQLFHLYLSGTHVPASERLRFAREILEDGDEEQREVIIAAIGAGLQFGHFSRTGTPSLSGHLDAARDWRPASTAEELDYYRQCYQQLQALIISGETAIADAAKKTLGENIDAILQTPLINDLDAEFRKLAEHLEHLWPEVKDQIKRSLELREDLTDERRAALERWQGYLTPPATALEHRLRDIVSIPGWHHREDGNGGYIDVSQQEAERLAAELAEQRVDLTPHVSQLLYGEQQQAFAFGNIIGKTHPAAREFLEEGLRLWPMLDSGRRNNALLVGLMHGLHDHAELRQSLLDRLSHDAALLDLLVPFTAAAGAMTPHDLQRITRAVGEGRLEPTRLRNLIPGQPLRNISDDVILREFQDLARLDPDSTQELFHILSLHCHRDQEKFRKFVPLLRELVLSKNMSVSDSHFGWEWHEAVKRLIDITDDESWLRSVSEYIADAIRAKRSWSGNDYLSAVTTALFKKAPQIVWDVFAQQLRDGDGFQKYLLTEFLGKAGSRFDDTGSPLWELPEDQFRNWARTNKDLIPALLTRLSLYTVETNESGVERYVWHPHATILLQEGVEQEDLAGALSSNLLSFGSVGSRVPYLEKRLRLVEDLKKTQDARLKNIASQLAEELERYIEQERRAEINEQARYL